MARGRKVPELKPARSAVKKSEGEQLFEERQSRPCNPDNLIGHPTYKNTENSVLTRPPLRHDDDSSDLPPLNEDYEEEY